MYTVNVLDKAIDRDNGKGTIKDRRQGVLTQENTARKQMQKVKHGTVQIKVKSVYGNDLIYPENETAQKFARLMGKKTLSKEDLALIKDLGFKIDLIEPDFEI